eukprot:3917801-Amphidinium_carterae.1
MFGLYGVKQAVLKQVSRRITCLRDKRSSRLFLSLRHRSLKLSMLKVATVPRSTDVHPGLMSGLLFKRVCND